METRPWSLNSLRRGWLIFFSTHSFPPCDPPKQTAEDFENNFFATQLYVLPLPRRAQFTVTNNVVYVIVYGDESFSSFHESGDWQSRIQSVDRELSRGKTYGGEILSLIGRRGKLYVVTLVITVLCVAIFYFIFQCIMSDWWRFCLR